MSKQDLPPDLVERSLASTVLFASSVVPLLKQAILTVKEDIERLPPGGMRHYKSELQLSPALVRLRMHQLIEGYNTRCLRAGNQGIQRRHIRNGAVCLVSGGQEWRLYKGNKKYPTQPTGKYQQALISQERFQNYVNDPGMFPEMESPLLNGLIYYETFNLELTRILAVITNGFDDDNCARIIREEEIAVHVDLEELATFRNSGIINILPQSESIVLSQDLLEPVDGGDPYAEEEPVAEEEINPLEMQPRLIFDPMPKEVERE